MALLIGLAACGEDRAIPIPQWRLVGAESAEVHAPAHVEEHLPARGGKYRLTADVPLPPEWRGLPLTLAIPRLNAPADLMVGGVPVESTLGGLLRTYRNSGAHKWRIPAALTADDRLSLELVVQDTWFQATWLDSTPHLSRHPDGDPWYRFVAPFNTASTAAALALMGLAGLSYLLVFLANRRNAEYGWFAAQGLGAAWHPFFALGATPLIFGAQDVRSTAVISCAALTSVAYTHAHFDLPAPSRVWLGLGGVNVVVAAIAGGPFSTRWGLGPTVVLTIMAVAIYQLQLLVRMFLRGPRRADVATLLASWIGLSLFAGTDFVHWLGFGGWLEGFSGAGLGLAIFAVLQTSALSREVAARDREHRRMADELRRQVSARSRQLSHALARLGRSSGGAQALATGEIIDERYRVRGRLGEGAMAAVYEVERLEDGKAFALKVLNAGADTRILARFAREAHIASEVTHPNVVGIHDIDFASSGFMYVILELVPGVSLKERADRFGDIPWSLDVLYQVARGLEAIHKKGVVHRDLKPANILLRETEDGLAVKISDFGVSGLAHTTESQLDLLGTAMAGSPGATTSFHVAGAPSAQVPERAADREVETLVTASTPARARGITAAFAAVPAGLPVHGAQLTQAGHLLGTPAYMAPELARGGRSEPSHDIYSFGIIAYELLSAARPFDRVPLKCRLSGAPLPVAVPLGERCPSMDPALCELLSRAMAFEPSERPGLRELVEALDAARSRAAAPLAQRSSQQDDRLS